MKQLQIILLLLVSGAAHGQVAYLSIDSCYAMAARNYPLVKQIAFIEQTKEYTIDNASRGYLPQLSLNGQGTYQSAVTQLTSPMFSSPALSKDQYKIYGELYQSFTDHTTIKHSKELANASATIEEQKIEVELYKLRERINQMYFGILLIESQIAQNQLIKNDIEEGIKKTNAAIANGISLRSNADVLQAELLKNEQRTIELQANRKGFADMLSVFIGQAVTENTRLTQPTTGRMLQEVNRPELRLFDAQKTSFEVQKKLIDSKNLPRIGLFFQGGYGRPALNMLSNDFDTYYIGGLKLNWNFTGFYTAKREKNIASVNQSIIGLQKEAFLFNTSLALAQQNSEVRKYQSLLEKDNDIIALRVKIKETAKNQLEQGTITTIDYLNYVNAEDMARQNLMLHKVQYVLAQYNYQTTAGN